MRFGIEGEGWVGVPLWRKGKFLLLGFVNVSPDPVSFGDRRNEVLNTSGLANRRQKTPHCISTYKRAGARGVEVYECRV